MEIRIDVPDSEKPILDAFKGYLFKKKIFPDNDKSEFIKAFYGFYRAGWLDRNHRTDLSINAYHEKFKDKIQ